MRSIAIAERAPVDHASPIGRKHDHARDVAAVHGGAKGLIERSRLCPD
jgi:hypothetical protein